ncbi:MAG: tRNA pseudouridine(13) synthase TruD [Proteobacteria bacterium]|nr:tRNA pseudouridine(13) synthase TruD [Pseudomonadota bacterium]
MLRAMPPREALPYTTPLDLRIRGLARQHPDDFRVDEIPAYLPSGHGEHLFVRFTKRGLSTPSAVRKLAHAMDCDPASASWAGLKDLDGVTTQWASFHRAERKAALAVRLDSIQILEARAHPHKLRTGQLRGNRFSLRLRRVPSQDSILAEVILAKLSVCGLPNYFGEQRFGRDGKNVDRAFRWLVHRGRAPRRPFERKLLMSVLQAAMFNDWLAQRIDRGCFTDPVQGDLMRKEDSGGLFVAQDLAEAGERMRTWEISPTGPIHGCKMLAAKAEARASEESILAGWGLDPERLLALRRWGTGSRRRMRVRVGDCVWKHDGRDGLLTFQLPAGSYASVLLRELLKPCEEQGRGVRSPGEFGLAGCPALP